MKAIPVHAQESRGHQDSGKQETGSSAPKSRAASAPVPKANRIQQKKANKKMASNDLMVGLEIGTSKICVVVGESRPDGTIKILGVGQAPSRGVRKGEIVDFETAMKCVHEAVVDAEQKSDVMINSVYVADRRITLAELQQPRLRHAARGSR